MTMLATGTMYEDRAVEYLQQFGVLILHRNFRCKMGEIDLIVQDGATLAFIEVRYRKDASYGDAAETVTSTKQAKIIRSTEFFLQTRTWAAQLACRFDVIAMTEGTSGLQIEWIKDAFHA